MSLERQLSQIKEARVSAVVTELSQRGMFRYPATFEAQSRILDDIREELPGLFEASHHLFSILSGDTTQGWSEDQARLIATGVDMTLLVLHELVTQERATDT